MKILNLYCGIGGNRKLWPDKYNITAVEFNEDIANIYKDLYPNDKVIVADAHQYLLENYKGEILNHPDLYFSYPTFADKQTSPDLLDSWIDLIKKNVY